MRDAWESHVSGIVDGRMYGALYASTHDALIYSLIPFCKNARISVLDCLIRDSGHRQGADAKVA